MVQWMKMREDQMNLRSACHLPFKRFWPLILLLLAGDVTYLPLATRAGEVRPAAPTRSKTSSQAAPAPPVAPRLAGFVEPPGAYHLSAPPPNGNQVIEFVPKPPFEDFDPSASLSLPSSPTLRVAGARGEVVPATAVLWVRRPESNLRVTVTPLAGNSAHQIPASAITVRRVVRTPRREFALAPRSPSRVVGWFLPRWQPIDLGKDEFREIWLSIHVPSDASPGEYSGKLEARSDAANASIPLHLGVYPFQLAKSKQKQLGIYYLFADKLGQPGRVKRELRDILDHGVQNLITDLTIKYDSNGVGGYSPDFSQLRRGLALIRTAGFSGTVVCKTGLEYLAHRMGLPPKRSLAPLARNAAFKEAAKEGMEGFRRLSDEFPKLRLVATNLDEILIERWRYSTYLSFGRMIRNVTSVPLYITVDLDHGLSSWMTSVGPLANILSFNGHSYEQWIARGHRPSELLSALSPYGDVAWFYHNARGTFFTAEWERILSGVFLWASPFAVHAPWAYQQIQGSPYDDTDGESSDFAMAVPDPSDPSLLVPTRLWEAMRQGGYDLRYIATLEDRLAHYADSCPAAANAARRDLEMLRELVDLSPSSAANTDAPRGNLDLRTPLALEHPKPATASEAPIVDALARRLRPAGSDRLRARIASHIAALSPACATAPAAQAP